MKSTGELASFEPGDVLVADTTTPDWEPVMKTAAAIVTNRGGRTCHAAIVAGSSPFPRWSELNVRETSEPGRMVTVSCAEGENGKVYDGSPVRAHRYRPVSESRNEEPRSW